MSRACIYICMFIVITPTFKAFLHITNLEVTFKHIYVFKILRQTIVEQSEMEIFTKKLH